MKQKINIISFNHYDKNDKDVGSLSIEIREKGKWLTYKKGVVLRRMKLTKKSYKNLKRLSSGIVEERYIEIEDPINRNMYDMEGYDSCDDDYCIFIGKRETVSKKEKALFVVQVFKWQPGR